MFHHVFYLQVVIEQSFSKLASSPFNRFWLLETKLTRNRKTSCSKRAIFSKMGQLILIFVLKKMS